MDEGSIENQERGSLASFGSGNTTDSEKVNSFILYTNEAKKKGLGNVCYPHKVCRRTNMV